MAGSQDEIKIPLNDWLDDFSWFLDELHRRSEAKDKNFSIEEVRDYFFDKYSDALIASYREKRILAADAYLQNHIKDFDSGRIAVVGEERALISKPLLLAMWAMFQNCPDDLLSEDFPVQIALDYIQRFSENK